jgi:dihydrofolate reductase
MRKLSMFSSISLDGYFTDQNNDMSFAKARMDDPEWNEFVGGNASGNGVLLFGRVTYEMMASFWPSPQAAQMMPVVAKGMNRSEKVVFSKTLSKADWNNTTLIKGNLADEVRKLKQQTGNGMVILGSGQIVAQLTQEGLIDEYQIVITPIVIGRGRTLFEGVQRHVGLKLVKSRVFKNGCVFLTYVPQ